MLSNRHLAPATALYCAGQCIYRHQVNDGEGADERILAVALFARFRRELKKAGQTRRWEAGERRYLLAARLVEANNGNIKRGRGVSHNAVGCGQGLRLDLFDDGKMKSIQGPEGNCRKHGQ